MSQYDCKYDCEDWMVESDGEEYPICTMNYLCKQEKQRKKEVTDIQELTDRLDDYRLDGKNLPEHLSDLVKAVILCAEYAEEYGSQQPASNQYASVTKAEFEQIRDDATLLYMLGLKATSDAAVYYDDHSVKLLFERSKQLYYGMSKKEKAAVLLLNNETPPWME